MDPNKKSKIKSTVWTVVWAVFFGLLYTVGVSALVISIWANNEFKVSFVDILYTMLGPLEGTNTDVIDAAFAYCVPRICIFVALYIIVAVVLLLFKKRIFKIMRRVGMIACACFLIVSLIVSASLLGVPEYLSYALTETTIYEDYYIDPATVAITADGETKNLIYIYLEAMETTYASVDVGGYQGVNYMPYLTQLAKENISFSDKPNGLLGGFRCPIGTQRTMAAILATTAGIPYAFPVTGINQDLYSENFAPGVTTIGDILNQKGYRQMFLCGSDADFAGRKIFYEQHGNYEVHDLISARADGDVPPHYTNHFWGYEDEYLYQIARKKLTELSASDQPFNLTMLTVDTHHPDGYICNLCSNQDPNLADEEKVATVVSCADRQLYEFVEWCKQQPFYEDTVIVITGDHPRMDTNLVEGVDYDSRTIYNCIINSDVECRGSRESRIFTAFDIFPTTLSAMGFQIEGERLGLGVNLLSDQPTLCESLGYSYIYEELQRSSDYYIEKFS